MTKNWQFYSWNVLHIGHEIKYNNDTSFILDKYPNEKDRIKAIKLKIQSVLNKDLVVISLQEVPGDLLNELWWLDVDLYYYKLPRKPSLYKDTYTDNDEYLVTLIYDKDNIEQRCLPSYYHTDFIQYQDPGKAALIIHAHKYDLTFINTHFPLKYDINPFTLLKTYIKHYNHCIIMGDFNCSNDSLLKDIESYSLRNKLKLYTNPSKSYTYKNINKQTLKFYYKTIDHILIFSNGLNITRNLTRNFTNSLSYCYDDNISDHSLLMCQLDIDTK